MKRPRLASLLYGEFAEQAQMPWRNPACICTPTLKPPHWKLNKTVLHAKTQGMYSWSPCPIYALVYTLVWRDHLSHLPEPQSQHHNNSWPGRLLSHNHTCLPTLSAVVIVHVCRYSKHYGRHGQECVVTRSRQPWGTQRSSRLQCHPFFIESNTWNNRSPSFNMPCALVHMPCIFWTCMCANIMPYRRYIINDIISSLWKSTHMQNPLPKFAVTY